MRTIMTKCRQWLVLLLMSMMTAVVVGQSYTLTDDDVEVVDGVVTSFSYDFIIKDIVIPDTLYGQAIVGIAAYNYEWDYDYWEQIKTGQLENKELQKITLPSTLISIGDYQFRNNSLDTIILPPSIMFVGDEAFNANDIVSFRLPLPSIDGFTSWINRDDSIININLPITDFSTSYAAQFPYTLSDDDVVVEEGIIVSSSYNFASKYIIIPDTLDSQEVVGINSIYDEPFDGSVYGAFYNKGIISIALPNSLQFISEREFFYNNLDSLIIPASVSGIASSAFGNCGLDTVIFEEGSQLISLGASAFSGNELTAINLPSSTYAGFEEWVDELGNKLETNVSVSNFDIYYIAKVPYILTDDDVVVVDGNLESCSYGFSSKFITIPNVLDGQYITSIDAPDVNGYYTSVFDNKGIVSITLPSSLKVIGVGEFKRNKIDSLVIPSSVEDIKIAAFSYSNIKSVIFEENSEIVAIGNSAFKENDIKIADFSSCENLTSIDNSAFAYNNLTTVDFDSCVHLKSIGDRAFAVNSIGSVNLSNCLSLVYVGAGAFVWNRFSQYILPTPNVEGFISWVNEDEEMCVNNTASASSSNNSSYFAKYYYTLSDEDVVVNDGIINSCNYDFSSKFIIIPDTLDGQRICGIDDLNNYSGVFRDKDIIDIVLPSTLEMIGRYEFSSNNLNTLILPKNVSIINYNAFAYSDIDSLVVVEDSKLSFIAEGAFKSNNIDSITLRGGTLPGFTSWTDGNGAILAANTVVSDLNISYSANYDRVLLDSEATVVDGVLISCSSSSTIISIPDTLDGQAVIGIDDGSSSTGVFYNADIEKITLPSTLEYIGENEFYNNSMDTLVIPSNVERVYTRAFYSSEIDVVIFEQGSELAYIGFEAFEYNDLNEIDLSVCSSLSYIGAQAFANNDIASITLTGSSIPGFTNWLDSYGNSYAADATVYSLYPSYTAIFPYTLTDDDVEIVDGVIISCSYDFSSKLIVIPDTLDGQVVIGIGSQAFFNKGIVEITFPSSLITIGNNSFNNNNLDTLFIPSSVITIEHYAFNYCNISSIVFEPNSQLTMIKTGAFQANVLDTVILPNSVKYIGEKAFYTWVSSNIDFTLPTPSDAEFIGWLDANGNEYAGGEVATDLTTSYEAKIPYTLTDNDVEVVGGNITSCSYDFSSKFIIIPETLDGQTVIGIGNDVFFNKDIVEVNLPSTLVSIGNNAFYSNNFNELNIPSSVTSIGSGAFRYCSIDSLTLPSSLVYMGNLAFNNNSIVSFNGEVFDGFFYARNEDGTEDVSTIISYGKIMSGTLLIPEGATTLVDYVFYNMSMSSVVFPSTLEEIGDYAFIYCYSLSSIDFSPCTSLRFIGESAFRDGGITSIALPALMINGFYGWSDGNGNTYAANTEVTDLQTSYTADIEYTLTLDDVTLVDGILVAVDYPDTYTRIIIPASLGITAIDDKSEGEGVFQYKGLQSVILPEGLESIGYYAFANNSLDTIVIPESVIDIRQRAFYSNHIDGVVLPEGLLSIGSYAFYYNSLSNITLPSYDEQTYLGWSDGNTSYNAGDVVGLYSAYSLVPSAVYTLTDDDVVVEDGAIVSCSYDFTLKKIIIPSVLDGQEVVSITGGFYDKGIVSVELPSSLITLGSSSSSSAFYNNAIDTVIIPASVVYIGNYAFYSNEADTVIFEEGSQLAFVDNYAFRNNSFDTLILPTSESWMDSYGNDYAVGQSVSDFYSEYHIGSKERIISDNVTFTDSGDDGNYSNEEFRVITYFPATEGALLQVSFDVFNLASGDGLYIYDDTIASGNYSYFNYDDSIPIVTATNEFGALTFKFVSDEEEVAEGWSATLSAVSIDADFTSGQTLSSSVPFTVDFYGNSYGADVTSWSWDFDGDGVEDATEQNPSYTYTEMGTYDVSLTVSDGTNSVTSTQNAYIKIEGPYTLTDDDVVVVDGEIQSCSYSFEKTSIIIPSNLDGQVVVGIGDYTFYEKNLTGVVLPETVEEIGYLSFYRNNISVLTIPSSVIGIGERAFYNSGIDSLIFEENSQLTTIGNLAFRSNNISEVIIPSSVISIGRYAFFFNSISSFILPSSVKEGSEFLGWETNYGVIYNGGDVTDDLYRSYTAMFTTYSFTLNISDHNGPLVDATVVFNDSIYVTPEDGRLVFDGLSPYSEYNYEVSKEGYFDYSSSIYRSTDQASSVYLTAYYPLSITITDGTVVIPNAEIIIGGQLYVTDANGVVRDASVAIGNYDYEVATSGYATTSGQFSISDKAEDLTIALTPVAETVYAANFTVTDDSANELESVMLTINNVSYYSDYNGDITVINLPVGEYAYTLINSGNTTQQGILSIVDTDVDVSVVMPEILLTVYQASFETYFDGTRTDITFVFDGIAYSANDNGSIVIPNLRNGIYTYTASAVGYQDKSGTITIDGGDYSLDLYFYPVSVPSYDVTFQVSDGVNSIDTVYIEISGFGSVYIYGGEYTGTFDEGTYSYTITAEGFEGVNGAFTVVGDAQTLDVTMLAFAAPVYTASLTITDGTDAIPYAEIVIGGKTYNADDNGEYELMNLVDGDYNYTITANGYEVFNDVLSITGADVVSDVVLTALSTPAYSVYIDANVDGFKVTFDGVTYESLYDGIVIYNQELGAYAYSVTAEGYDTISGLANILNSEFYLYAELSSTTVPVPTYTLSVDAGIQGATVTLADGSSYITGASGIAIFDYLEAGSYAYTIVTQGYENVSATATVVDADVIETVTLVAISAPVYTLDITVKDNGTALADAVVSINGDSYTTNSVGKVSVYNLEAGTYAYTISSEGYESNSSSVVISDNASIVVSLEALAVPVYSVVFTINDGTTVIEGASVSINGEAPQVTDATGKVTFTGLAAGDYTLAITANGYFDIADKQISVMGSENRVIAMNLIAYEVMFAVTDGVSPIVGAQVMLTGYGESITDANGEVRFESVVPATNAVYTVSAQGYRMFQSVVNVLDADVSQSVVLSAGSALKQIDATSIEIYPNPATNMVTINAPIGEEIRVLNLSGKVIFTAEINQANQEFNISMLQAGIYLIQVDASYTKLIVE